MIYVTDFVKFLKKKQIKSKPQCAIHNYLSYFCRGEQKLTQALFTEFYKKTLLFPYWQSHLNTLQKQLSEELHAFTKSHSALLDPKELLPLPLGQLITLQQESDLIKAVHAFLQRNISEGDQVAIRSLNKKRVLAIILKVDGRLKVSSFGPLMLIHQGELEPLTPLSQLYYSPDYELNPAFPQTIEDNKLNFIHFQVKEREAWGLHCQDLSFQPTLQFKQQNIKEIKPLFTLLKKTESCFIQSKSDPHYKNLINGLYNHYRQILISPPKKSLKTEALLSQAKSALKDFYPEDRLLFLLTANIDFHLRKKQNTETIINKPSI